MRVHVIICTVLCLLAVPAFSQTEATIDSATGNVELVREADTVSTRLFMAAGEVEAEVESAEGLSNDLRIRSTEATAAVRGTSFVFDGRKLRVAEGRVAMQNRGGLTRFVVQTQESSTSGTSPPELPRRNDPAKRHRFSSV
jgi:hypothetical protein